MKRKAYVCIIFSFLFILSSAAVDNASQDHKKMDVGRKEKYDAADQKTGGGYGVAWGHGGSWGGYGCDGSWGYGYGSSYGGSGSGGGSGGGGGGGGGSGGGGGNDGEGGSGSDGGGGSGCQWGCCGSHIWKWKGCSCCRNAKEAVAYMQNKARP